jgi:hypothetical protein
MSKLSKASVRMQEHGPVQVWEEEADGFTIDFVTFLQEMDHTPVLKGLPDDRCQCPHWGYVLKGGMTMRFADHEEVYSAGDAFYAPPGHVPVTEPGTEILQFSPSNELRPTSEAIMRNLQSMQAGH